MDRCARKSSHTHTKKVISAKKSWLKAVLKAVLSCPSPSLFRYFACLAGSGCAAGAPRDTPFGGATSTAVGRVVGLLTRTLRRFRICGGEGGQRAPARRRLRGGLSPPGWAITRRVPLRVTWTVVSPLNGELDHASEDGWLSLLWLHEFHLSCSCGRNGIHAWHAPWTCRVVRPRRGRS